MKTTPEFVFFWRTAEVYSNWHHAPFKDEAGQLFENSEKFMMWAKARLMGDELIAQEMLAVTDPKDLKAMGRRVRNYEEAVWVRFRTAVMVHACFLKFSQNEAMKTQLLATDKRILVEASPYDTIWGIGLEESDSLCLDQTQWKGMNLLGVALMIVRELLRENQPLPQTYTSWMDWKMAA